VDRPALRASAPTTPVAVPATVMRLARGHPITPVWRNELSGLTFRLGDGGAAQYVRV